MGSYLTFYSSYNKSEMNLRWTTTYNFNLSTSPIEQPYYTCIYIIIYNNIQ